MADSLVEVDISSPTSVQRAPAVSAAGSTWLVVWHDCRNARCDIFGGRVNSTGSPLDGTGFPISSDVKNEFVPDVAYNGTRFPSPGSSSSTPATTTSSPPR